MTLQALDGIRVLDASTVLAAPVTATLLGDFGAEVVKVEEPGRGDFTRGKEPGGRSPQWAQEARNKESITLNLREPAGQEVFKRLVPHFDVVILNNRPATLDRWGLDAESLSAIHPGGILTYITGFGLTGPFRDRGAFDRIASSFAGLTYVSGDADRAPVRTGYALIDFMSAYLAAFGVLAALRHRDRTGEGQVIDLALYEAGFRASEDALLRYAMSGEIRERQGNSSPHIVPATDFQTLNDGRISMHAGTDTLFRRLCQVISMPEIAGDERFSTRSARAAHADVLYPIIAQWMGRRTSDEVVKVLAEADIPVSEVMSIADIHNNAHYRDRQTIVQVEDPDFGSLPMVAPLPMMSRTPGSIRTLGPVLGEHNTEIYGRLLGMNSDEIDSLKKTGVI